MSLVVYGGDVRVGVLDMAANEPFYGFTYDSEYLSSGFAMPLSLSLPLQEERFDGARTLPFFEGLLPEGDVRAAVARQLGISDRSPAKLLRALGKDCSGDVTVLEEDDPFQPPADDLYERFDGGLANIATNPYGEISRLRAAGRLSLAGGQEKITLYHDDREAVDGGWWVPIGGSPSTHIVKPQVLEAYPLLVENEYFCMRLAKHAGLDVAEVSLLALGRSMLVVRRFDRAQTDRTNDEGLRVYRRLKQEDFCQALGFDSSHKYESDGGPRIADVCGVLLEKSVRFLRDRDELLRMVVFNYLIGNCDAHAKNYSAMLGRAGAIQLAPAYDLVSTTVYDGFYGAQLSRDMGMSIGTHSNIDRITAEDFALLAGDLGIANAKLIGEARAVCNNVLDSFGMASYDLQDSTDNDVSELTARIRQGIEKRACVIGVL